MLGTLGTLAAVSGWIGLTANEARGADEAGGPDFVNDCGVISRRQVGGDGGLHVEALAENNRRHVPLLYGRT